MHLYTLLLFSIVQCDKYMIKTQNGKKIEVSWYSPVPGHAITSETRLNSHKKSHFKKNMKDQHKNAFDYYEYEPPWENKCSLHPSCSTGSCRIQKDIPGCGGSIDLTCAGGCIKIIKVSKERKVFCSSQLYMTQYKIVLFGH